MFGSCQICRLRGSSSAKILRSQIRWKNKKNHWSEVRRQKQSTDKALEFFDDFYKQVFDKKWPSIRLGLLSANKYCAVVNNYSDSERVEKDLENWGAINVKKLIMAHQTNREDKATSQITNEVIERDSDIGSELMQNERSIDNAMQESPPSDHHLSDNNLTSERLILPDEVGKVDQASALYDFVPATRLKGMDDYVPESEHFVSYKRGEEAQVQVNVETQNSLHFPDSLKIYSFDVGNMARFPKPDRGSTGVSDYYLMDGSSVLPVLCLDLKPGDRVLDVCAAPGGKSLLCHQTLLPSKVVSNDLSLSRLNRLKRMMDQFFYDLPKKMELDQVQLCNLDARRLEPSGQFNKILVDVPCTTDRFSVTENDNNIFRPDRIKERIDLPNLQTDILVSALKCVEDGGAVVYSTCSLSPVQNDGVVQAALKRMWEETNDNFVVVDLTTALEPYSILYRFSTDINLRYGNLVVPYLPSNFGPMYFCKLVKRNKNRVY